VTICIIAMPNLLCHPTSCIWHELHQSKRTGFNQVLALAAYNAGRGHVESWIHENNWNGMVDTIPFPETRSYVKAVLQYQERYEQLMLVLDPH